MKHILIAATIAFACIGGLSACSGMSTYNDRPTPQAKPSISNIQTEDLYQKSQEDDNGLNHWVFEQKLPSGKVVTCVAAEDEYHGSLGISCLPPESE